MPSTQEFRRRIKSVNSTKQITKAMEMIASIKMQKAVKNITLARAYIQNAWNILHLISKKALPEDHELVKPHKDINKTAVILITSDRGLCGSYNSEVIKKLASFKSEFRNSNFKSNSNEKNFENSNIKNSFEIQNSKLDIVAIGKFGASYVNRYKLGNLVAEFKGFENNIAVSDVIPISKMTVGEYLAGNYDKVVLIYSHFVSSIKQVPVVQQILPITEEHIDTPEVWEKDKNNITIQQSNNLTMDITFEPSPEAVVDGVLKQILRTQIYGAVLEANASEQSARMVAMKNATDNATDLIDDLKLAYNTVRQDSITREIAEISGAAEAMK